MSRLDLMDGVFATCYGEASRESRYNKTGSSAGRRINRLIASKSDLPLGSPINPKTSVSTSQLQEH